MLFFHQFTKLLVCVCLLDDHSYYMQYDTAKVTAAVKELADGGACIEGTSACPPDPSSQHLLLTSNLDTGATQHNALQVTLNELKLEIRRLQWQVWSATLLFKLILIETGISIYLKVT